MTKADATPTIASPSAKVAKATVDTDGIAKDVANSWDTKTDYDIAKVTLAGANRDEEVGIPGLGGALSPDIAGRCLKLLEEAREAYEGQGFAQQADGAARFGVIVFHAGVMARLHIHVVFRVATVERKTLGGCC